MDGWDKIRQHDSIEMRRVLHLLPTCADRDVVRDIYLNQFGRICDLESLLATATEKLIQQEEVIRKQAERLKDIEGWEIDDSGVPEVGYRYRFLRQPVPNPKEVENDVHIL